LISWKTKTAKIAIEKSSLKLVFAKKPAYKWSADKQEANVFASLVLCVNYLFFQLLVQVGDGLCQKHLEIWATP
jgi:hypothetical protein